MNNIQQKVNRSVTLTESSSTHLEERPVKVKYQITTKPIRAGRLATGRAGVQGADASWSSESQRSQR